MDPEEARNALGITEDEFRAAIEELESLLLVDSIQGFGQPPRVIMPASRLFIFFDHFSMPWDPFEDAKRVAALLVDDGDQLVLSKIAERLDWQPRRLNPAVNALVEADLVTESGELARPHTTFSILYQPETRLFFEGKIQLEERLKLRVY